MAERTRPKLSLVPSNPFERWSLFSSVLVWAGVLVFGIGLAITLRNQKNERLAYASLEANTLTTSALATATLTPTPTPQIYPVGWSTATPTPIGGSTNPTPRASAENESQSSGQEDAASSAGDRDGTGSTGLAAPRLALTPQLPPSATYPPDRLVIPKIELDSAIVPIGWVAVEQEGIRTRVWEVADDVVGWHNTSSHPGQVGNVVLNGHHNIKGEVFRYLVDLEPGDQVHVYAQGKRYRFAVTEKHILKEKGEPLDVRRANARWIEPTDDERLTIITCWPYTNNTHRLVVVAKPVPIPSIEGLIE